MLTCSNFIATSSPILLVPENISPKEPEPSLAFNVYSPAINFPSKSFSISYTYTSKSAIAGDAVSSA